jgi:predicted secreted protein
MFFLFGCAESSIPTITQLDSSVNGKSIHLSRNQRLLLDLEVHYDGGYQWDCQLSDSKIINKDSTHVISKNSNFYMVGGTSVETFYFSSNNVTGECEITLIEHRIWEKDISPINKVQFLVFVK